MAMLHATPGEVIDVRPLGSALPAAQTQTLVKTYALEVIRLVLPAGKKLPPHRVPGEITVHCLEGRVNFWVDGAGRELTAGTLLYLAGGSEHSEAIDNSSLLVTILLTPKT
jgi:quercetin dioxygenase-like cupin family protein